MVRCDDVLEESFNSDLVCGRPAPESAVRRVVLCTLGPREDPEAPRGSDAIEMKLLR